MKHLVEFPVEGGGTITIEAEGAGDSGPTLRSNRPLELAEKAQITFEEAMSKIAPVTRSVVSHLRQSIDPPSSLTVEFALKFTAEAGAVIATAGAEANFKITMAWSRTPEPAEAAT